MTSAAVETGYREFSQRLHERAATAGIPIAGSIELNSRCNLRCVHCYHGSPSGLVGEGELGTTEWFRIIDELAAAGCLWLLITGGEPFLRRDLLDVVAHAQRRGLLLTLFTNATMITPEVADGLARLRPFSVEVPLYGSTAGTHEQVTRVAGSFARCLRGIELLCARDVPLKLKTIALSLNLHELRDLGALAGKLGISFVFDPLVIPCLDGTCHPQRYRLSPAQVVALDGAVPERAAEWRRVCAARDVPPDHPGALYRCGAGRTTFHVDAHGMLSPCLLLRQERFDLRRGRFSVGWQRLGAALDGERWQPGDPCRDCSLWRVCQHCPALAELETGDAHQRLEYHCEVARRRVQAFGGTVFEEAS